MVSKTVTVMAHTLVPLVLGSIVEDVETFGVAFVASEKRIKNN